MGDNMGVSVLLLCLECREHLHLGKSKGSYVISGNAMDGKRYGTQDCRLNNLLIYQTRSHKATKPQRRPEIGQEGPEVSGLDSISPSRLCALVSWWSMLKCVSYLIMSP